MLLLCTQVSHPLPVSERLFVQLTLQILADQRMPCVLKWICWLSPSNLVWASFLLCAEQGIVVLNSCTRTVCKDSMRGRLNLGKSGSW